jgi:hypothetical protein
MREVFGSSQSQLTKYTNPEAKDRRTKISSYLDKVEAIGGCLLKAIPSNADNSAVSYQTTKMIIDLVRGTHLVEQIEDVAGSDTDFALDELWRYLEEIPAFIDRETDLYNKYSQLQRQLFSLYKDQDKEEFIDYLSCNDEFDDRIDEENALFHSMPRIPLWHVDLAYVRSQINYVDFNNLKHTISFYPETQVDVTSSGGYERCFQRGPRSFVFKDLEKNAFVEDCGIEFRETVYLVLRPNYPAKRLGVYLMVDYSTVAVTKSAFFKWHHLPKNNQSDQELYLDQQFGSKKPDVSYFPYQKFNLGDNPDKKYIGWVNLPKSTLSDITFPGKLLEEILCNPAKLSTNKNILGAQQNHMELKRDQLDLLNNIFTPDLTGLAYDHDEPSWGALIPTVLNHGSIAHALDYSLVDTASSDGLEADAFLIPELMKLARQKSAQIDRFLNRRKNLSKKRLDQILTGRESII